MQSGQAAMDEAEERFAQRTNLCLSAMIQFEGGAGPVRLRDLSDSGAKVEGSLLPKVGAIAQVTRGNLTVSGAVVWREPGSCGLRFTHPVSPEDWVPNRMARDQLQVDGMVAESRLGVGDRNEPAAAPMVDGLPKHLSEEMAYVARLLESLGDDLSADPVVIARHMVKMQSLDIAIQILGHLARVIVADHPEQAIAAIGMDNLRKRLQRVSL
jgi:hypothetical protein